MSSDTFPQFSKLPTELRSIILSFALPERPIGCFLYPYKPGYWSPRRLSAIKEWGSYSELAGILIEPVSFSMPLLLVNRPARAIARSWMEDNGVQIRYYRDTESLVSPFLDEMRNLFDRGYELQRLAEFLPGMQRLAVPLSVLQDHEDSIPCVVYICPYIEKVHVVTNRQPDLLFPRGGDDDDDDDNNNRVHQRWELRKTEVARLWDPAIEKFWWGFHRGDAPTGYVADWIERGADDLEEMMLDAWTSERRKKQRIVLRAIYAVRNEHQ
ncbi:hypothetical protein ASPACDRAFT_38481 [Aspergillus aculeatus ATCC 16872]|uniref:2EXR domain-containing protein n=1 Tax=Aspergillus aculeatus (strain ATCC 16872 / CBS 172.66 / WB 5094) TaxID=690307 RepID=A0A1L9X9B6_ASPA1|nr:uncharacterized protein ASPACDRAFT_38481 [Aspergillus aculeatus ATCC 16872]OJK04919.1 hypothetical protein ASPACDRAFT_38481 [Aspergillus aculeatus ATCC 16872]